MATMLQKLWVFSLLKFNGSNEWGGVWNQAGSATDPAWFLEQID